MPRFTADVTQLCAQLAQGQRGKRHHRSRKLIGSIGVVVIYGMTPHAHAEDARWTYPRQLSMSPLGVNLQTGRYTTSIADISIGDLKFQRNWGDIPSLSIDGRSLGSLYLYTENLSSTFETTNSGWSHNFDEGLHISISGATPEYWVVVQSRVYHFKALPTSGGGSVVVPIDETSQGTDLHPDGAYWVFVDRSGSTFLFSYASGGPGATNYDRMLLSVTSASGVLWDYSYSSAKKLTFVRSSTGFAIALKYDGNGNVSQACGFGLAQAYADATTACSASIVSVTYAYDGSGQKLVTASPSVGGAVSYSYTTFPGGASLLTCLSVPGDPATCALLNDYAAQPGDPQIEMAADQVRRQTTATGAVWKYIFLPQPDPADVPVVAGRARYSSAQMTSPFGELTALRYDRGRLIRVNTPLSVTSYRYRYHINQTGQGTIDPRTNEYIDSMPGYSSGRGPSDFMLHDPRGNLIYRAWGVDVPPKADAAQPDCCITEDIPSFPAGTVAFGQAFLPSVGYQGSVGDNPNTYVVGCGSGPADAKRCDKPIARFDAKQQRTDYVYSADHGGILSETGPADRNGIRPQVRYTYVYRRAWLAAPGGGYAQEATGVWLPASKSLCRTGDPASSGSGCSIAGDEVLTTYEYGPESGPNNLLLRGVVEDAGGVKPLRTCYRYDAQGNRISETKPLGMVGVGACP